MKYLVYTWPAFCSLCRKQLEQFTEKNVLIVGIPISQNLVGKFRKKKLRHGVPRESFPLSDKNNSKYIRHGNSIQILLER